MKKFIIASIALLAFSFCVRAQEAPDYNNDGVLIDGKSIIIKADLMGLALRNYGFSVERILSRKMSLNLGLRIMPSGNIPMLDLVKKQIGSTDPQADAYLDDLKINSFAFTPELRIYTGKHGYGRGFYFAPYYNYFSFNLEDLTIEEEVEGKMENAVLSGGIKTHCGGIMLGYQWLIGAKKNIVIDWGIFGIHAGASSGNLDGKTSRALDPEDQANLKNAIDEQLNSIPLFKFTTEVDANSAKVTEKGPWAFLRGNLSIGFRF